MIEMRAIVIALQVDQALVQPVGTGGCGHCTRDGGCGSSTLTKFFCDKPRSFEVRNDIHAQVGDEVQVLLPDGVLLRGAIKMYVLPLILLLAGGLLGVGLVSDPVLRDVYSVAGATSGLLLGFALAKFSPGIGRAVASSIVSSKSSL